MESAYIPKFYDGPIDGYIGSKTTIATQSFLLFNNLNPGPVDGYWGDQTAAAIQRFLQSKGYQVGPIDGNLRHGRVSTLAFQTFLRDEGIDPGPLDGSFGTATIAAWQRYLQTNKVTGEPTVNYKLLFSCSGGSSGHRTIKVKTGIREQQYVSQAFQQEISSSICLPVHEFIQGLDTKLAEQFAGSLTTDTFQESESEVHVNLDRPCYIYQMMVKVPTKFGVISINGCEVFSGVPIKK